MGREATASGGRALALHIDVSWRIRTSWHAVALLRRVARYVAHAEGFRTGQLSIAVVGAATMSTLHNRFMGIPEPTDVLTFDLGTQPRRGLLAGEIVVCADVARTAARGGDGLGPARAELALYVTHGILHLAGYDDHAANSYRRMHAREDVLLTRLRLGAVFRKGTRGK